MGKVGGIRQEKARRLSIGGWYGFLAGGQSGWSEKVRSGRARTAQQLQDADRAREYEEEGGTKREEKGTARPGSGAKQPREEGMLVVVKERRSQRA
jgi:hypothetical protein